MQTYFLPLPVAAAQILLLLQQVLVETLVQGHPFSSTAVSRLVLVPQILRVVALSGGDLRAWTLLLRKAAAKSAEGPLPKVPPKVCSSVAILCRMQPDDSLAEARASPRELNRVRVALRLQVLQQV
jgi:hypothetical protein